MLPGRAYRQGQAMAVPAGGPRGVAHTPPHPCPGSGGAPGQSLHSGPVLVTDPQEQWQVQLSAGPASSCRAARLQRLKAARTRVLQGSQGPTSDVKRE